jgi:integrase
VSSIREIKDHHGQVVALEAFAGYEGGRKKRKRFGLRKYGNSIKACRKAADRFITEHATDTLIASSLSPHTKLDAARALDLLEPLGIGLLDAVRELISLREARGARAPYTFGEAVQAVLQSRLDMRARPEHLRPLRVKLARLSETFGDQLCDSIQTEDLEQYIRRRARSAHTWRNYRRDLGLVFRFAIRRGRATRNPAEAISRPEFENEPVPILRWWQLLDILSVAPAESMPYIVLSAFAGLRPFELNRVSQDKISLDTRTITIEAKHSKSRQRRFVHIEDALYAWLRGHVLEPKTYWQVHRLIHLASTEAKVYMAPDVLRHSFASHHLALYGSAAKTAHELGHRSEEMLYRHYRELVTRDEAETYFSLYPSQCHTPACGSASIPGESRD